MLLLSYLGIILRLTASYKILLFYYDITYRTKITMINYPVPYHNKRPLEIAIWHFLFKVNSFKSESVDSNIYSWQ